MCIVSGREGVFTTPVARCTRLRASSSTNHHAAFAASPAWTRGHAKSVTIMLLLQKGKLNWKTSRDLGNDRLWLRPSRLRFRGTAAWTVNLDWSFGSAPQLAHG